MGILLAEENFSDVQCLIESKNNEKKYKIHGVFAQAERKNKNGRIYRKNILEREINRYNSMYVSKRRAIGELNHPETPSINLDRVSHVITELYANGNDFIGTAEIIDTECGKTVKALLDAGIQLGVSTRGVGSLRQENGYKLVGEDFFLATIDIVADPSAPDAFVQALRESKNWIMENGNWSEQTFDKYKRTLELASKADYEKTKLIALGDYLSKL